jgi:ribosomal protein L16/L10AE
MAGVELADATEAMRLASHKLPVATRFVTRELVGEGSGDGHR